MRAFLLAATAVLALAATAMANPAHWKSEGWKTYFSKTEVALSEIISGGPPRDGIPSIDDPQFVSFKEANEWLVDVDGLPFPSEDTDDMLSFEAAQLFVSTARRISAEFSIDNGSVQAPELQYVTLPQ